MKIATMQGDGFQTIVKSIAKELGVEFIPAKKTTENLLQYSDKIAPDNWCLDVKIIYGSIAEQISEGADTILVFHYAVPVLNYGPCLLPWACDSYFKVGLKKMFPRKKIKIISMSWWNKSLLQLNMFNAFKSMGLGNKSLVGVNKGFDDGLERAKYMDKLKELFYFVGAVDYKKTSKIYHDSIDKMKETEKLKDVKKIFTDTEKELLVFQKEAEKLPVIGLTGDLFALLIDNYPFFNVEEMMIRDLGVAVYQPFTFYKLFDEDEKKRIKPYLKKSGEYIKYWMGGSDYYTIPYTIEMKEKEVDGIVHLSVFACQPEMIARSVIRMIEQVEGIPPMLELTFDSHTQPEAIKVRLEAFVDMIKSKIEKRKTK